MIVYRDLDSMIESPSGLLSAELLCRLSLCGQSLLFSSVDKLELRWLVSYLLQRHLMS